MQDLLVYSFVVACISFTISEAAIFKKLRTKVKIRSRFFGNLICCGYCTGFYVAALVMIIYQPRIFFLFAPIDYLFTWFVLAWLSGIQWALVCIMWKIAGK